MPFLRDELQTWWDRWKEPSMLFIAGWMSVYFALTSVNWSYMAIFFALAGLLFMVAIGSYRSARLKTDGLAIGHVEVDERRLTYFVGGEGFSVSVDNLREVGLESIVHPSKGNELMWIFKDNTGSTIRIPATAPGASGMFDNLAALKGISYSDAVQMISGREAGYQKLWSNKN